MRNLIDIIIAVLAVYGVYTLVERLWVAVSYPSKLRKRLRAAVLPESDGEELGELASYARHLAYDRKISGGRLIIVCKSGIMKEMPTSVSDDFEVLICQETKDVPFDAE